MNPKLVIITVVYCDDVLLERTYDSVHRRYSGNYAHYIFMKDYKPELFIKYGKSEVFASHDKGIYNAMNLGFAALVEKLHETDCVLFLNSGDVLQECNLVDLIQRLQHSSAALAIGAVRLTRAGLGIGTRKVTSADVSNGRKIFFEYPCHQSTIYKAEKLLEVYRHRGYLYDEGLKVCADLELYLLLSKSGVLLSHAIIAEYDASGYSDNAILQTSREKMRLVRRYETHSGWLVYAAFWRFRARCAYLKRSLFGRQ